MLGLGRTKPIVEHEAEGDIERVYHEIRQVLRVSGVNLNFRSWAAFDGFLPAVWESLAADAGTREFEEAADQLRSSAVKAVGSFAHDAAPAPVPGESRNFQIDAALRLYHYINPKLLLFTSAAGALLEQRWPEGGKEATRGRLPRGVPADMYAMEMVEEEPEDPRLRALFEDIKGTLSLESINSDYRTLALWPDYLDAAWRMLKPLSGSAEYAAAAKALGDESRRLVGSLAKPVPAATRRLLEAARRTPDAMQATKNFEKVLPPVMLDIALMASQRWGASAALASPFPARAEAGVSR